MKLFNRWVNPQRRIRTLEAQLANTRELAMMYAGQLDNLSHTFAHRGVELGEVADLVRKAHRTMNLQRSGRKASQAHLREVLTILDGAR